MRDNADKQMLVFGQIFSGLTESVSKVRTEELEGKGVLVEDVLETMLFHGSHISYRLR